MHLPEEQVAALAATVLELALLFGYPWLVLRMAEKLERWPQTVVSLVGVQALIAAISLPLAYFALGRDEPGLFLKLAEIAFVAWWLLAAANIFARSVDRTVVVGLVLSACQFFFTLMAIVDAFPGPGRAAGRVLMHIHILGICGTFMGGLAALARELGHDVTGADRAAWPPMSTRLKELGVEPIVGFEPGQLDAKPDLVLVGNIMSRGMPLVEALLDSDLAFMSGPEWLGAHVLHDREVIVVTGTHGKTTTAGMAAWLLEAAGLDPGFLIGGAPGNFDRTARLGGGRHFVIEGDEYDTAFFDKNAKFLHYRGRTVIINNIEHDHADIYTGLDAVLRQFHLLLRRMPGSGRLIVNGADSNIQGLLEKGCWTPVERFSVESSVKAEWRVARLQGAQARFQCSSGEAEGTLELPGSHNLSNALAAVAAAQGAGVDLESACRALGSFRPPARRLQLIGRYGSGSDIALYDDFAHHPTAIRLTLQALKQDYARVLAVFEPASNSMRSGAHLKALPDALSGAEHVWLAPSGSLEWDPDAEFANVANVTPCGDAKEAAEAAAAAARPADAVVFMSNSGASGCARLLAAALSA